MAHAVRALAGWMSVVSVVIIVSLTASSLTWLFTARVTRETQPRGLIIRNGTAVVDMFRVLSSKAHVLLKVKNTTEDGRLVWEDEWRASKILLDETETWITVKERGVYLIFIQVTYALVKDGDSTTVDLRVIVDFNFTENRQQFAAAFDTRQLSSAEQDAHLTSLLLMEMKAGEKISVSALPKKWIDTEPRPFCSFITIVRYADW